MQPQSESDYKKLLTEVIQKQMVILGPSITLTKARNVKGLTVTDEGTVTQIEGQPQELIQELINQFVQLSDLIVRKTMEPLLSISPDRISQNYSQEKPTSQSDQQSSGLQGERNK